MKMRPAPLLAALALIACRGSSSTTAGGSGDTSKAAAPPATDGGSGATSKAAETPTSTQEAETRDHMHLEGDGISKEVWISGWASIPHPPHREYAFAGPLGCAGQRFKTNFTRHTGLDIGYTAHQAFVILAEDPYVLSKPPVVEGKTLVWAGSFKNADDGSTRWFRLRIDCPLPTK